MLFHELIYIYDQSLNQLIALQVIAFILLIAAIILTPMFGLYYLVKLFWEAFIEPSAPLIISRSVTYTDQQSTKIEHKNTEEILLLKFSYYQKLNDLDKAKFLKRIAAFISEKEFRALSGLTLTEDMIVLISASAIQLTFGLEEFRMDHFSKFFIYPKAFYSKFNKAYHKGETNLAGVIVLSWKHFNEGYSISNDNLNLGLHEMAHALRFDKFKSDDYDKFFSEYIDKWQLISREEFRKIKNKEDSFFRSYAGTNFSEFFSVCVEYFFESPKEFKINQPEIYKHLCILLNQDPLLNITDFNNSTSSSTLNYQSDIGSVVFSFKGEKKSVLLGLIWLIPALIFAGFMFSKKDINDRTSFYVVGAVILVSSVGHFFRSKEAIEFYTSGIKITSGTSNKLDSVYYYEQVVSVIFSRGQGDGDEDSVKINRIERGKIKNGTIIISFSKNEMEQMGNYLTEKKIPVKFDGFDVKLKS